MRINLEKAMEDGFRLLFKNPILFLLLLVQVLWNFLAGQYIALALLKIISPGLTPQAFLFWVPTVLAQQATPEGNALPLMTAPAFNQAMMEKFLEIIWDKLSEIISQVAPWAFLTGLVGFMITLLIIRLVYNATQGKLNFLSAIKLALQQSLPLTVASLLCLIFVAAGAVLLVIPGIIIFIRLSFFSFAGMIDQGNIWTSVTKSWRMTRGNVLIITAFYIIFGLLFIVATGAATLLAFLPSMVTLLYSLVMGVFLNAVFITAMTMIYLQMRTSEEIFD